MWPAHVKEENTQQKIPVAANNFEVIRRLYYAHYVCAHRAAVHEKYKIYKCVRCRYVYIGELTTILSFDLLLLDAWIDCLAVYCVVVHSAHTDTNKIIIIMMNDAIMWPKRIEKVVLVVIMSWHNVFVLIANSFPFSLNCFFFFFFSFVLSFFFFAHKCTNPSAWNKLSICHTCSCMSYKMKGMCLCCGGIITTCPMIHESYNYTAVVVA